MGNVRRGALEEACDFFDLDNACSKLVDVETQIVVREKC
jgi:hypothetical protein